MTKKTLEAPQAKGMFVVKNDRGLHTRPSTEIVKCASSFKSEVSLCYKKKEANAKSLLGILMLAATKGAKIRVIAQGVDAEEAVSHLIELSNNKFNISY
jgi:phosphocarrier protein HPr